MTGLGGPDGPAPSSVAGRASESAERPTLTSSFCFWSAWEAFAAGTFYRDTIQRAVRNGTDTDTTAAIAGGLAGLRWGLDERSGGTPEEWLSALRGRDIVEGLLAHL